MIVDYTNYLQKENSSILLAQGKEKNILILGQEEDGEYWLEYRWLSVPCMHSQDEAVVCVQGMDVMCLEKEDIKEILGKLRKNQFVNLFDYFQLF